MFLSVPCKKIQDVELQNPLLRYIKDTYNEDTLNNVRKPIEELQLLRNKIGSVLFDKHEATLEALKKYHDSLVALEPRIPLAENGVIVDFKWYDAFSEKSVFSKNYMKSNCGAFERLCILFCIGALNSQLAAAQPMNDDAGLKYAAKSYQIAAGIFEQIRLLLPSVTQSEPTLDFKQETLILLANLMIAQAQETIFIKAEKDQMKSSMVAKVAAQAHTLYTEANRMVNLNSLKGKFPKGWSNTLAYKQGYFEVMTHVHQAKACAEDQAFGEEIARYKLAYQLAKNLSGDSKEVKTLSDSIKNMMERAIKDNDVIYHAPVPDVKSIRPVAGAVVAKPSQVECPLLGDQFKDPFVCLVPMGVQLNLDSAQKILQDLIQDEVNRLKEATDTCNCMMQSLNLTTLAQDDGEVVPGAILEESKTIRNEGGLERLRELASSLPDSRQRNLDILNIIRATIDDEQNADDNLRQQYGNQWRRKPSDQLNGVWRKEIQKYDEMLAKTGATDEKVLANFTKHCQFYEQLSLPEAELIRAVSSVTADCSSPLPQGSSQLKDQLKSLVSQIDTMKADRADLIAQLQKIELPEDLRGAYLRIFNERGTVLDVSGDIARESINAALEGPRGCIRESIDRQKELLENLQQSSTTYFNKHGAITDARSTLLTNLKLAGDEFPQIKRDLSEGMKFYGDVTNVLLKMQAKVDDFVFARKTEKEELMADVNLHLSKVSIDPAPTPVAPSSNVSNVPPPRPTEPPTMANAPPAQPPQAQASAPAAQMPPYGAPQTGLGYPMASVPYPGVYGPYGYPAQFGMYPGMPPQPYGAPQQQQQQQGAMPPPLPYNYAASIAGMPPMQYAYPGMPAPAGSGYPIPGYGYPPAPNS